MGKGRELVDGIGPGHEEDPREEGRRGAARGGKPARVEKHEGEEGKEGK